MKSESIRQIVKVYLPEAREELVQAIAERAEREIEATAREIVRKTVLKEISGAREAGSLIDTKA